MSDTPRGPRVGIKGPLMFSALFAVIAFFAVLFFASGGTDQGLRFDLAFSGAGIAFIVCLVIAAMLSMSYKENAEHLGQGSGVNLRSADREIDGGQAPEARDDRDPRADRDPRDDDTPED
ncbi:hypothetical protein [Sinomonas mesophila]|uniref:hypothetical protein n=1 Tax=Sinomonas mesophila TaxID=1531955 RepID=UPI000985ED99|nr:hypothetical protein [Sinomonas mesophila]